MSRTYRRKRFKFWNRINDNRKNIRDGENQYVSMSCRHHKGCPVCHQNRNINNLRRMEQFNVYDWKD